MQSWTNIFGSGFFPFHTDFVYYPTPPRILLLRLADKAESFRDTLLIDTHDFSLSEEEFFLLRNEKWKTSFGRKRTLIRIIEESESDDSKTIFRYDPVVMKPFMRNNKGTEIVENTFLNTSSHRQSWKTGDVLIINNWRVVHARDYTHQRPNPTRVLERIILR